MGIVPNIARIVEAKPGRMIFARFTVPPSPNTAQGSWRTYYEQWTGVTAAVSNDPGLVDLVGR